MSLKPRLLAMITAVGLVTLGVAALLILRSHGRAPGTDPVQTVSPQQVARSSPPQQASLADADELVEGTPIDPSTLSKEAAFVSAAGERVTVYTGSSGDRRSDCILVRFGESDHDGADSCGTTLFEKDPVAVLETFSLDATGQPTTYRAIAIVRDTTPAQMSLVDNEGQTHPVTRSGRVGLAELSPSELRDGRRPASLRVTGLTGAALTSINLRAG